MLVTRELDTGEVVVALFTVTLGLVSDTTEPIVLEPRAVETRLVEFDEE